mmetsp:Transcript_4814/g.10546  ORF Transcript_4814/g.10546 Transcript_4814/m.10546 type:complete len:307 (+) Transcript_4814:60-980(+)
MKRPAEETLVAERPPPPQPSNPFAGISLTATSQSGGLFSAAAAGFGKPSEAPAQVGTKSSSSSSNPFMGLSLYSSSSGGSGLFTSAANSLPSFTASTGTTNFSASSTAPATASAADATKNSEKALEDEDSAAFGAAGGGECTGEEGEEVLFRGECKLWKLVRQSEDTAVVPPGGTAGGSDNADTSVTEATASAATASAGDWKWQERGCGVVRVNRNTKDTKSPARLVMRMRGVLKVLLNTPIFPTTSYEKIGQKSVKFVGIDEERAGSSDVAFCAYRLNLQNAEQQSQFLNAVQKVVAAPKRKNSA